MVLVNCTRYWPILLPECPRIFGSWVIPSSGLTEKGVNYPDLDLWLAFPALIFLRAGITGTSYICQLHPWMDGPKLINPTKSNYIVFFWLHLYPVSNTVDSSATDLSPSPLLPPNCIPQLLSSRKEIVLYFSDSWKAFTALSLSFWDLGPKMISLLNL